MRRILFVMALSLACLAVSAQNNNEQKQGNVSVTQSDDISNLVNGPKKQEPQQEATGQKDNGATQSDAPSHENADNNSEHHESASSSSESDKPRERPREQREKEKEDKTKIPSERDYLDRSGGPADLSKKVVRGGRKVWGYRVQVFGGGSTRADRQKAEQIGKELKEKMPSQPVFVHFISPRWTCRVGNFRKADHANTLLKTVKKLGYKQACIVKTVVVVRH